MAVWRAVSRWLAILALFWAGAAAAHEVQPAVADFEIGPDRVQMSIRMTLEAPLAGVDLAGLTNTNDSGNSDVYDRMREMPPEDLRAELEATWPRLANRFSILSGGSRLTPELDGVSIPDVANPENPRFSVLRLSAALPPGTDPLVLGWDASMGGIILRQQGAEDGYTAFLQNGQLSDEIPRLGGGAYTLSVAWDFLRSGFTHIVPLGLDHILFVLGLFFFALKWGPLLWQVTSFTLAHSVTLALATLGIVTIPPDMMWLVEALIALSIVWVAVENIFRPEMGWFRFVVVFAFGLLHGLGFASVLSDVGLPQGQFVLALVMFNVGVEFGQLAVILAAFLVLVLARLAADKARLDGEEALIRDMPALYRAVSLVGSILIAIVGLFWFLERIGALPGA
ncbi:MAG: HupE/UreJ family protein [Pseudomonadota bacterium]